MPVPDITQLVQVNFDLLSVAVAIAGIALLGTIIFFNNPASATNRTFFALAGITVVWSISNYLEYKFTTPLATLWALRAHLFISTWYAFIFFQFAYVFPKEKIVFPRRYTFVLVPVVASTALVTLTPFVFSGIGGLAPAGEVTRGIAAPGIALFMFVAFGLLIASIVTLIRRMRGAQGIERRQIEAVFIGMTAMAVLILIFNVILPNVFSNVSFIPLAGLFILPLITLLFYAIYRHHLFNLKVAATAFLGFMVTVFTFANIVYSTSLSEVVINVTAFTIVLIGSIKIVRDTLSLQQLTEELTATNERQEGLIHFIGHEVKNFLAKAQNTFALMIDGDLGQLPDTMRPFAERALKDTRDGVESVGDILKASNLKKGTTEYKKEPFDLKALVAEAVEKEKQAAEQKKLALTLTVADNPAGYTFAGDKGEIGDHVLKNLIENSLNYTPSGKVEVSLKREGGKYIFTVADTGIGITDEDKKRLFTEGGHGQDSQRVNVHSTGYGLFIAKNIVVAHGGTIRAESAGAGKGAQFIVELPA